MTRPHSALRYGLEDRMIDGGDWHIGIRRIGGDGFEGPAHRHRGLHELMLGIAGTSSNRVRDETQQLERGDLTFVGEQSLHQVSGRDCTWINIAFADHYLHWADVSMHADGAITALPACAPAPRVRLGAAHFAVVEERLCALNNDQQGLDDAGFRLMLADCLLALSATLRHEPPPLEPDWLRRALAALIRLPAQEWSKSRLRELAGVSDEHLCRVMRRELDCSPTDHLNQQRLELAARWLREEDTAVTRIALDAGYHSANHFYLRFRRHFGCSPGAYRKRHRDPL